MTWITSSSWDLRVCILAMVQIGLHIYSWKTNLLQHFYFIITVTDDAAAAVVAMAQWFTLLNFASVYIIGVNVSSFSQNFRNITQTDDTVSRIYFLNINSQKVDHVLPRAMKNRIGFYQINNENNWKNLVRSCHRWKWISTQIFFFD